MNNANVRLSNTDKLSLISNLGTMLGSGIPILDCVDSMLAEVKGSQKKILEILKNDLGQGKTISESFSRSPNAFDPVTLNLIKAAEEAGTLDTTLKDLSISIKKDIEFSDKIKAALTYPAFVFVIFSGVLLMILTFVIPRIATVFSRLKVTLPLPTKILIFISGLITSYWPVWIALGILIIAGVLLFYRYQKRRLVNFLYSLPLLNKLARLIDLTRFTRSMGLLLSSGIPITEALTLSENVVSKKEIGQLIQESEKTVASGKKISDVLLEHRNILPGIMLRIIEAGEKSGTLEKSMQELSDYFENEVSNQLKTITTLLEPVMLVVIGILVGGMMLSIIAPIYQLIGDIRTR